MKKWVLSIGVASGLLLGGLVGVGSASPYRFLESTPIEKTDVQPREISDAHFLSGTISRVEVPCISITNDRFFCACAAIIQTPPQTKEKK